jgi:enoyl-CoA hydratase/carnithine racemase
MSTVPPTARFVSVELADGVATVLLDRPERDNAWTLQTVQEMSRIMRWCDDTEEVRAVVVGARGRVFCVGADLAGRDILHPGGEVVDADGTPEMLPSQVRKPVIAALHGHAVGIGTTYALHCDLRLVAEDAKMGIPFVRRGVVPEVNSSWLLPRLVGLATAVDLALTGRLVLGHEAVALGLCHRVLPRAEVLPEAQRLAARIAADGAPVSLGVTKRLLWQALDLGAAEAHEHERAVFTAVAGGPDTKEGIASFLEKRPPRWTQSVTEDWPDELR